MQIQAEFASFLDVDNAAFESKVKAVSLKFFFILIFLSCVIYSYVLIIVKYHLLSICEARKTIFLHEVGTSTENVPSALFLHIYQYITLEYSIFTAQIHRTIVLFYRALNIA